MAAIVFGGLMLTWPAFFNGYPLLYPDSMSYLEDGGRVARAVFLHQLSPYYGMRSFFYSMGILLFDQGKTAWPIVGLQCMLVAFVLWLTVRPLLPRRPIAAYLMVMGLLSVLTSVSWYACVILPDILGALVYLSMALLTLEKFKPSILERTHFGSTTHSEFLLTL